MAVKVARLDSSLFKNVAAGKGSALALAALACKGAAMAGKVGVTMLKGAGLLVTAAATVNVTENVIGKVTSDEQQAAAAAAASASGSESGKGLQRGSFGWLGPAVAGLVMQQLPAAASGAAAASLNECYASQSSYLANITMSRSSNGKGGSSGNFKEETDAAVHTAVVASSGSGSSIAASSVPAEAAVGSGSASASNASNAAAAAPPHKNVAQLAAAQGSPTSSVISSSSSEPAAPNSAATADPDDSSSRDGSNTAAEAVTDEEAAAVINSSVGIVSVAETEQQLALSGQQQEQQQDSDLLLQQDQVEPKQQQEQESKAKLPAQPAVQQQQQSVPKPSYLVRPWWQQMQIKSVVISENCSVPNGNTTAAAETQHSSSNSGSSDGETAATQVPQEPSATRQPGALHEAAVASSTSAADAADAVADSSSTSSRDSINSTLEPVGAALTSAGAGGVATTAAEGTIAITGDDVAATIAVVAAAHTAATLILFTAAAVATSAVAPGTAAVTAAAGSADKEVSSNGAQGDSSSSTDAGSIVTGPISTDKLSGAASRLPEPVATQQNAAAGPKLSEAGVLEIMLSTLAGLPTQQQQQQLVEDNSVVLDADKFVPETPTAVLAPKLMIRTSYSRSSSRSSSRNSLASAGSSSSGSSSEDWLDEPATSESESECCSPLSAGQFAAAAGSVDLAAASSTFAAAAAAQPQQQGDALDGGSSGRFQELLLLLSTGAGSISSSQLEWWGRHLEAAGLDPELQWTFTWGKGQHGTTAAAGSAAEVCKQTTSPVAVKPAAPPPPPPLPTHSGSGVLMPAAATTTEQQQQQQSLAAEAEAPKPSQSAPAPAPPPPPPPAANIPSSSSSAAAASKAAPPPPPPPTVGSGSRLIQLSSSTQNRSGSSSSSSKLSRVPRVKEMNDKLLKRQRAAEGIHVGKSSRKSGSESGGHVGAAGEASAAGGADAAKVFQELLSRSPHQSKIAADLENYHSQLTSFAAEVAAFKPSSMQQLVEFVSKVQQQLLSQLYDETAALKQFSKWPAAKWQTLWEAADKYNALRGLQQQCIQGCTAAAAAAAAGSSSTKAMEVAHKVFSEVSVKLDDALRGEAAFEQKMQARGIPWEVKPLVTAVKEASVGLGTAYLTAAVPIAARCRAKLQDISSSSTGSGISSPDAVAGGCPAQDAKQQKKQLLQLQKEHELQQQRRQQQLDDAIAFVFKVHQFAQGLNESGREAVQLLAAEVEAEIPALGTGSAARAASK